MLVVGMHTSVGDGRPCIVNLLLLLLQVSCSPLVDGMLFGVHDLSFLYFLHITHYVHLCTLRPYTMSQTAAMRW